MLSKQFVYCFKVCFCFLCFVYESYSKRHVQTIVLCLFFCFIINKLYRQCFQSNLFTVLKVVFVLCALKPQRLSNNLCVLFFSKIFRQFFQNNLFAVSKFVLFYCALCINLILNAMFKILFYTCFCCIINEFC